MVTPGFVTCIIQQSTYKLSPVTIRNAENHITDSIFPSLNIATHSIPPTNFYDIYLHGPFLFPLFLQEFKDKHRSKDAKIPTYVRNHVEFLFLDLHKLTLYFLVPPIFPQIF